jgi:predicted nucleotidyltransferase
MPSNHTAAQALAERVAKRFAAIPEVEAVALAGSRQSVFGDDKSDIDLYVYAKTIVPLEARAEIARHAQRAEIGNSFWEPGDEWIDSETGLSVDIMYRTLQWIEDQLDHVLLRHEASVGYSTCFWYNLRNSQPLFDRSGWFRAIQKKSDVPYPDQLKRAIVAKNYPILRRNISSYLRQIELATARHDAVSVNHRTAAMLASYFDILFAVNGQPHPGEKRLVEFAQQLCKQLPDEMPKRVAALLAAVPEGPVAECADRMLDGLDGLLRRVGLL